MFKEQEEGKDEEIPPVSVGELPSPLLQLILHASCLTLPWTSDDKLIQYICL